MDGVFGDSLALGSNHWYHPSGMGACVDQDAAQYHVAIQDTVGFLDPHTAEAPAVRRVWVIPTFRKIRADDFYTVWQHMAKVCNKAAFRACHGILVSVDTDGVCQRFYEF